VDDAVVRVRGLTRRFGARFALRDVDLEVGRAQIVGIAGPNGAGKSTLLQILAGLLRQTAGSAAVFGFDPWRQRLAVMRRTRFAFAPPGLFVRLSAREHLVALGGLGAPAPSRHEVDATLATVGLAERAGEPVANFSFGMRQRLALAIALLPCPELLVLDEPAEGLDPLLVLGLREVLQRLRATRGLTVLLSSHLLLELDALVDHLVVLDDGTVVGAGAPADLRGPPRGRLRADDAGTAQAVLAAAGLACDRDQNDDLWLPAAADLALAEVQALLARAGVTLLEYARERRSLQAAVLACFRRRRPAPERTPATGWA